MARKYRYREIKSEINIIPLLDVFLALLLIFMVTAPIINQSIEIDLPYSTHSQLVTNNDNLMVIVEISGIEQYNLIIDHNHMEHLLKEQFIFEAQALITMNPKAVFLIGGARNIPYDEVIKVLNLLHQAGVKSVGLMTQPI